MTDNSPNLFDLQPALYTIGYQGRTITDLIVLLQDHGVRQLIDVRRDAYSRNPDYTGSRLREAIESAGIRYIHLPELGIPKEIRSDATSADASRRVLDWYENEYLPDIPDAVNRLAGIVKKYLSALMCYETKPSDCHRGRLAPLIARLADLPLVHL
ncbi:MAG TPA: DUF488 domain-containing protein [candidate division Zixibacteria bacterium]|nr:DUF488 domain-containing protein [candidate division Zixibacteria bacterium]